MPKGRLLAVNHQAWCLLATISLLVGIAARAQDAVAEKKPSRRASRCASRWQCL